MKNIASQFQVGFKSGTGNIPPLDGGTGPFGRAETRWAGVNKHGAIIRDFLEVNNELLRIVFGVCEKLGTVKGKNVIDTAIENDSRQ